MSRINDGGRSWDPRMADRLIAARTDARIDSDENNYERIVQRSTKKITLERLKKSPASLLLPTIIPIEEASEDLKKLSLGDVIHKNKLRRDDQSFVSDGSLTAIPSRGKRDRRDR